MKVQIIGLEPNDDLASLRDKVLRAQASLVILQAASPCPCLQRPLDLVLAHRWATSVGSSLALATQAPSLRAIALSTPVPSFPTVEEALAAPRGAIPFPGEAALKNLRQAAYRPSRARLSSASARARLSQSSHPGISLPDRRGRGRFGRDNSKRFRTMVFSAGIGLALIPFLLGFPSAVVRVEVPSRSVDATAPVPSTLGSKLSAQVQVSARKLTSGAAWVPTQNASGSVLVRNVSSDVLLLPPGIEIQAIPAPILFVTSSSAVIDPRQLAWVGVQALPPGPQGNLPSGSLGKVVGPLGLDLQVSGSTAMQGGQDKLRGVVAAEDLLSLRQELEGEFRSQALARLQLQAPAGSLLVPETLATADSVQPVADGAVGTAVDTVGMTLSGQATVLAFSSSEVEGIAIQALTDRIGRGEILDLQQINLTLSGSPNGEAVLVAHARAYPAVDLGGLTNALRLQRINGVSAVVRNHCPPGSTYLMAITPSWLSFLPLFPWRIYADARPS